MRKLVRPERLFSPVGLMMWTAAVTQAVSSPGTTRAFYNNIAPISFRAVMSSAPSSWVSSTSAARPAVSSALDKQISAPRASKQAGCLSADSRARQTATFSFLGHEGEHKPILNADQPQSSSCELGWTGSSSGLPIYQERRKRMVKVIRSAGLALAWYAASSAAAVAVSSVSGLPYTPRPQRRMPIAPTLLLLYLISDKKIKTRNRFDGVVPKDDGSLQRLADDAYGMAMSWGKPAGRMALFAVDLFFFLVFFRYSGYDFGKLFVGRGMEQLLTLKFWVPYGGVATLGALAVILLVRRLGHGFVRNTMATALAPLFLAAIVKPAKAFSSVLGAGGDWDLGISKEERQERRRASLELRESLSTFQDVNFADEGGRRGADMSLGNVGSASEDGEENDDSAPPDLKRTS